MGRLIDADAFAVALKRISEKQGYSELYMNVDDVLNAVIDDLQGKTLYGYENCPTVEAIPKDQYEARLKAEREKIAEDVANKMNYMGSCLNEKNIILGIITGKRETTDSLCPTCKSECCVSNGTAICKADFEARLKADMVAMLVELDLTIDEIPIVTRHGVTETVITAQGMRKKIKENIQQKINALKEQTDGNVD